MYIYINIKITYFKCRENKFSRRKGGFIMYLKKNQLEQINDGVKELHKLASLENCTLPEDVKKRMKCWVIWIDVFAEQIEDALNDTVWDKYNY